MILHDIFMVLWAVTLIYGVILMIKNKNHSGMIAALISIIFVFLARLSKLIM